MRSYIVSSECQYRVGSNDVLRPGSLSLERIASCVSRASDMSCLDVLDANFTVLGMPSFIWTAQGNIMSVRPTLIRRSCSVDSLPLLAASSKVWAVPVWPARAPHRRKAKRASSLETSWIRRSENNNRESKPKGSRVARDMSSVGRNLLLLLPTVFLYSVQSFVPSEVALGKVAIIAKAIHARALQEKPEILPIVLSAAFAIRLGIFHPRQQQSSHSCDGCSAQSHDKSNNVAEGIRENQHGEFLPKRMTRGSVIPVWVF